MTQHSAGEMPGHVAQTAAQKAERRRAHYAANRERLLARQRAYYQRNRERFKAYQQKQYAERHDEILATNRARRASNREAYNLAKRTSNYGITPNGYAELLAKQGGRCAICGTDAPVGRGAFCIDHDHETGMVRGLLCSRCNTLAASAHLERHIDAVITYLGGHRAGS